MFIFFFYLFIVNNLAKEHPARKLKTQKERWDPYWLQTHLFRKCPIRYPMLLPNKQRKV